MGRNKNKRKQQGTQGESHQPNHPIPLPEKTMISESQRNNAGLRANQTSDTDHPVWWKMIIESFKRFIASHHPNSNWWVAAFTAVLAFASIYQYTVTRDQLKVMSLDVRPWITVTSDNTPLSTDKPVIAHIHLKNTGKTPARSALGIFMIERVQNGNSPNFLRRPGPNENMEISPPRIASATVRGIVLPGADNPSDTLDAGWAGDDAKDGTFRILRQDDLNDLIMGKFYFSIYGWITYKDMLGGFHWTQFCTWIQVPGITVPISAMQCANYNNADENR